MQPYSPLTAETLLRDWETLARPTPDAAYSAARAAMHTALAALLPCLDPDADVNLDAEDLRSLLHRASTFRSGTATARGPRRAEEAVAQALTNAMWLGFPPTEPPLRGLLFMGSAPDAELEMDELTDATERLREDLRAPEVEIVFGCNKLPALPSGTLSVALLLVYGPLLPGGPLLPLPQPPLPDYSDPAVAFEAAARLIVEKQFATTTLLQRHLKLGYHRSCRILDELEQAGIIGPFDSETRRRLVLVPDEQALAQLLDRLLL